MLISCLGLQPIAQVYLLPSTQQELSPLPDTVGTESDHCWKLLTDLVKCDDSIGLVGSFPLHEDLLFIGCILQRLHRHGARHCQDKE